MADPLVPLLLALGVLALAMGGILIAILAACLPDDDDNEPRGGGMCE